MAIQNYIFGPTKKQFFKTRFKQGIALTFKDVSVKTGLSEILPSECNTTTRFSRNIKLKIPIVSAAMDTVTEHTMAILIATMGGIGVIHKNLTPKDQAREVVRTKYYLNGMIESPICVEAGSTMSKVIAMREKEGYRFHRFPVVDENKRLCGILTKDDFDFCTGQSDKVQDNMSREVIYINKEDGQEIAYKLMQDHKKKAIPVVDSDKRVIGMYLLSDLKRIRSGESSTQTLDEKGRLRVAAAIGTGKPALDRFELLADANVDCIVIDTAHGDSLAVFETIRGVREINPSIDIIAGNISEPSSAQRLINEGVDGIKVGQGPGSICTTRIIAGVGAPQVTAIYSCHVVARESNIPVCGDGGIKYSGDIVKAIAAGADTVMLGSLLAGTKEAPGEIFTSNGQMYKTYRGMGSLEAMMTNTESRNRYRQGNTPSKELIPEGVEGRVPYKGPATKKIQFYVGGLRSGMGYAGTPTIEQLKTESRFHQVTTASETEAHPSIEVTSEAPNYQK